MNYGLFRLDPEQLPQPKDGMYLYFYADEDELESIAAFSPDIAALYHYTYNDDGYFYCLATDFYKEDPDSGLLNVLLNSGLLNYDYFMKSNRPGYQI